MLTKWRSGRGKETRAGALGYWYLPAMPSLVLDREAVSVTLALPSTSMRASAPDLPRAGGGQDESI